MFNFKKAHKAKVDTDSNTSLMHAKQYLDKLASAFATLEEVGSVLLIDDIKRNCSTDCFAETAPIKSQGYTVKLLFSCDSDKPVAANIIPYAIKHSIEMGGKYWEKDMVNYKEKYNELIMAVQNKHTTRSRHETALAYIKSCENKNNTQESNVPI